jgi:hypothetical protein
MIAAEQHGHAVRTELGEYCVMYLEVPFRHFCEMAVPSDARQARITRPIEIAAVEDL